MRCPDCNHGLQADGWCWIHETHYRPAPIKREKSGMAQNSKVIILIAVTITAWGSLATAVGAVFFPWWGYWISSACVGVVLGSGQCIAMINEFKVNRPLFTIGKHDDLPE